MYKSTPCHAGFPIRASRISSTRRRGSSLAQGYRHTQMSDIAEAVGLAKGTIYLYVESKDALFDLVLRSADAPRPIPLPPSLPVRPPARGRTLQWLKQRLAEQPASPTLLVALSRPGGAGDATELTRILGELYEAMARNRPASLRRRCAVEYPPSRKSGSRRGARRCWSSSPSTSSAASVRPIASGAEPGRGRSAHH
jgi:AcrR family transcriptional regulator